MHITRLKYSVLFLLWFVFQTLNAETKDQQIKVELRTISHEFLLQVYDSTSRILPIEKVDGRYEVRFENEFAFEPDLLLFAVYKIYESKEITNDFIVEVEECETKALVHSFRVSQVFERSMGPCKLRGLPKSCYIFYFTEVETDSKLPIKEVYVDNMDIPVETDSMLPIKAMNDVGHTDNKPVETEKETPPATYVLSFLALAIGGGGLYYFKSKASTDELIPDITPVQTSIAIGQYAFDKKAMTLTRENVTVELSAKETDLLVLLFNHEDETLEREFILNQVWKDEGNYVGRTLDVFISKLRKKLADDPNIKIVNVRGVGYRFVVTN